MCRPITCPRCSKTGWTGCGQHVDQVMAVVPANQQCQCPDHGTGKAEGQSGGGFLGRLFG